MDSIQAVPFYSLEAHKAEIVKLVFLDKERILVSASKDCSIKFWKVPGEKEEEESLKKVLHVFAYKNKIKVFLNFKHSLKIGS